MFAHQRQGGRPSAEGENQPARLRKPSKPKTPTANSACADVLATTRSHRELQTQRTANQKAKKRMAAYSRTTRSQRTQYTGWPTRPFDKFDEAFFLSSYGNAVKYRFAEKLLLAMVWQLCGGVPLGRPRKLRGCRAHTWRQDPLHHAVLLNPSPRRPSTTNGASMPTANTRARTMCTGSGVGEPTRLSKSSGTRSSPEERK